MRRACLRLRAKGIRWSCRTSFAVEVDILARVVPSRASSMGPTSSIPHGKSMLGEDCSLWYVCMYVCMHVCIYLCMYIFVKKSQRGACRHQAAMVRRTTT